MAQLDTADSKLLTDNTTSAAPAAAGSTGPPVIKRLLHTFDPHVIEALYQLCRALGRYGDVSGECEYLVDGNGRAGLVDYIFPMMDTNEQTIPAVLVLNEILAGAADSHVDGYFSQTSPASNADGEARGLVQADMTEVVKDVESDDILWNELRSKLSSELRENTGKCVDVI